MKDLTTFVSLNITLLDMPKWIVMIVLFFTAACVRKENADLLVYNARVYTVDSSFSVAESFAVKNGKILAVGTEQDMRARFDAGEYLDGQEKYIYPGFIDAHCHFYNYGLSLQRADLSGTRSFNEVLDVMKKHYNEHHPSWLIGRGWDQNDWKIKEFPDNSKLDELFPDIPVMLTRIDGHAAVVNSFVLKQACINSSTKIEGGEVVVKDGKPTGVLIDNAMELVLPLIPVPSLKDRLNALVEAEKNCFAAGLTTVADAGLDRDVIMLIDNLQKAGCLKMKIYAMLSPTQENFDKYMYKGIYMTERLNVRSVKLYTDGALGSRGACLLSPYADDPGNYGLMVETQEKLKDICDSALKYGYQVNVHAIGDSGVRTILNIFKKVLSGANGLRWRIEHAQVVANKDFPLFRQYSIVPSVQPTHATSDMYWAEDRLGSERVPNAYAYKKLMEQNGWIAFGTDFPIEKIEPLMTFYAAVFRKDLNGWPEKGWQMDDAVSREQALRAMTIWAARACFEDSQKGSLEPGKSADFVILDRDIITEIPLEILKTRVLMTFINGKMVFGMDYGKMKR
jgi:predicted amidohydrolase YtcJ